MRRVLIASVAALALGALAPAVGSAAPLMPPEVARSASPVVPVEGWWEQQHREKELRERYWRLPPSQRDRYDRLQAEINQLHQRRAEIDAKLNRSLQEQYRILGFQGS